MFAEKDPRYFSVVNGKIKCKIMCWCLIWWILKADFCWSISWWGQNQTGTFCLRKRGVKHLCSEKPAKFESCVYWATSQQFRTDYLTSLCRHNPGGYTDPSHFKPTAWALIQLGSAIHRCTGITSLECKASPICAAISHVFWGHQTEWTKWTCSIANLLNRAWHLPYGEVIF